MSRAEASAEMEMERRVGCTRSGVVGHRSIFSYSAWTRGALNKSDPPWSSAGERSRGCVAAGAGALPPSGGDCDYLDPHQCLLHFLQVKPVQSQASPTQGPSLWSALPWVGAKGSEMNLSSHCLPGRPWASLPAPQSVRRQQFLLSLGKPSQLQAPQRSSRRPSPHKAFIPLKGGLETNPTLPQDHCTRSPGAILHLHLLTSPVTSPRGQH